MPLGKKGVTGEARATTEVINRVTGEVEKRLDERWSLPERDAIPEPLVMIGVEHGTTMNVNFQSVMTKAWCTLPCANNPKAVAAAYERAWFIVEDQLSSRASWAAELLQTLNEARVNIEGRKK